MALLFKVLISSIFRFLWIFVEIFGSLSAGALTRSTLLLHFFFFFECCLLGRISFRTHFSDNPAILIIRSELGLGPLQVSKVGLCETIFSSFDLLFNVARVYTLHDFRVSTIRLRYLFIITISDLVVLRCTLGHYYYHSQSIYVYDNIINFHSCSGI